MRRVILPLCIVLALQLALALGLAVRRDPLAGVSSDTPLLPPAALKSADQLTIEGRAEPKGGSTPGTAAGSAATAGTTDTVRVALTRKDGIWVLPAEFDAPADKSRVSSLLDRLSGLKRGLPIATSDAALRRFKLEDADFERRLMLSAGGKTLDTLYLGTSPGVRKSDARIGAEHAVYAVDLPTYDLPTDPNAWLDADLLRPDADKLTELDVDGGSGDRIALIRQKTANTWADPELPAGKQVDSAHAEALAQQLAQLHVDAVLGTELKPDWQQDHPALKLDLKDDQAHSVNWTLSKPSSGDFYVLKSSAHPWYFSVSSALAKQIIDAGGHDALLGAAKPAEKAAGKPSSKS